MKPFETRYTEWLEDKMPAIEQQAFEAELALPSSPISRADAERDRAEFQSLGRLLRTRVEVPPLKNADFFNAQVMREIHAEEAVKAEKAARTTASDDNGGFSPFARYLWAGGGCVAMSILLFFTLVLPNFHPQEPKVDYYAQILNTEPGDPSISAVAFHDDTDNITVLWLDGLDYLPKPPAKP